MDLKADITLIDSFPFVSYLGTNYIPSDEEMLEIKTFLVEPTNQLQTMKTEIDRLEAQLADLSKNHDNFRDQMNACKALITFPRRMPNDILQEIFYQSLPTWHNAPMNRRAPPLIFTQVCRQWRGVALSTPKLWDTINI
ncbi:hypothetical protein GALMADRAFT_77396, partial [Galerina marginata CBS 339.88]